MAKAGVDVGKTKAKPAHTGAKTAIDLGFIPIGSQRANPTGNKIAITAEFETNSVQNVAIPPISNSTSNGETSVIFASLIGLIIFREKPWHLRIVAAIAVTIGLIFISLSR